MVDNDKIALGMFQLSPIETAARDMHLAEISIAFSQEAAMAETVQQAMVQLSQEAAMAETVQQAMVQLSQEAAMAETVQQAMVQLSQEAGRNQEILAYVESSQQAMLACADNAARLDIKRWQAALNSR